MNVRVDENRFLSVACEPQERVVFDRQETKYHLLRDEAARLWDEIGEGGSFELASVLSEAEDPIAQLAEAGLISIEPDQSAPREISRRVWLTRTGKASAAAVVLPLVATIATPRFALGQVDASLEDRVDGNNEPIDIQQTRQDPDPPVTESNLSELDQKKLERKSNRKDRKTGNTQGSTHTSSPSTDSVLGDRKTERKTDRRERREENRNG